MEKLKRIKTTSLRAQTYASLKSQLMKGVWKVGDKIPSESELCASLGVSRVTVRTAIQQLEILGLVETRHGGGTYVRSFGTADAMDILHPIMQVRKNQDVITVLEYRKIVEKGAVRLAAARATEADLQSLEESYAAMCACAGDPERFAEADLDFHLRIARMSRNPILIKVCEIVHEILATAMTDIVTLLGPEQGVKYHRLIIDTLRKRDADACEALMGEHIELTIESMLRIELPAE